MATNPIKNYSSFTIRKAGNVLADLIRARKLFMSFFVFNENFFLPEGSQYFNWLIN